MAANARAVSGCCSSGSSCACATSKQQITRRLRATPAGRMHPDARHPQQTPLQSQHGPPHAPALTLAASHASSSSSSSSVVVAWLAGHGQRSSSSATAHRLRGCERHRQLNQTASAPAQQQGRGRASAWPRAGPQLRAAQAAAQPAHATLCATGTPPAVTHPPLSAAPCRRARGRRTRCAPVGAAQPAAPPAASPSAAADRTQPRCHEACLAQPCPAGPRGAAAAPPLVHQTRQPCRAAAPRVRRPAQQTRRHAAAAAPRRAWPAAAGRLRPPPRAAPPHRSAARTLQAPAPHSTQPRHRRHRQSGTPPVLPAASPKAHSTARVAARPMERWC